MDSSMWWLVALVHLGLAESFAPRIDLPLPKAPGSRPGLAHEHDSWRQDAGAALSFGPNITEDSIWLVTSRPEVLSLDLAGNVRWRRATDAPPAAQPLPLSGGRLAMVSTQGTLVTFNRDGLPGASLPLTPKDPAGVQLAAFNDGSFVVAYGRELHWFDNLATRRSWYELTSPIQSIQPFSGTLLIQDRTGALFRWTGSTRPKAVGAFPSAPRGRALVVGRSVIGLFSDRLDWLDLSASTPPFSTPIGAFRVSSEPIRWGGRVAVVTETAVSVVEKDATATLISLQHTGTTPLFSVLPTTNDDGSLLLALADGRTVAVTPDGSTAVSDRSACSVPLSLDPLPSGAVLLSCQDGTLLVLPITPAFTTGTPTP